MALLPEAIRGATGWVKDRLIYMTGKGLFGMGMIAAAVAFGAGVGGASVPFIIPVLAIGVTGGLQALMTYRSQMRAEDTLLSVYREEIASRLGKDPAGLTHQDLLDVANGDPQAGRPANRLLQDAIDQVGKRHMMQFVTTAAAGLMTGLVLMLFTGLPAAAGETYTNFKATALQTMGLDSVAGWLSGQIDVFRQSVLGLGAASAESTVALSGTLFVAGTAMGVFNNLLEFAARPFFDLNRRNAHELIQDIRKDLAARRAITPEQVFGVYVAADPTLSHTIQDHFGKDYNDLSGLNQHRALIHYGKSYPIAELTEAINSRSIDPTELAFTAVGQASGRQAKPRQYEPENENLSVREMLTSMTQSMREGFARTSAEAMPIASTPANDNITGFASRFAPKQAEHLSHAERVASTSVRSDASFAKTEESRRAATADAPLNERS